MSESGPSRHRRRPRYRGTHPQKFHEKYKELDSLAHPNTIAKVIASGKTPAGMHRPVCLEEVLEVLAPQPGEMAVDATLGYGGHALTLWERVQPGGRLLGLDVDPMELAKTEKRLRSKIPVEDSLVVIHSNFAGLIRVLAGQSIPGADVILADLGCSSMQLDNPDRGFSWKHYGPLDLRMNPDKGLPAADLLDRLRPEDLERMLREFADEPEAADLARFIHERHQRDRMALTGALAGAVVDYWRERHPNHDREAVTRCQQRVFQAIRIAVNDEFKALETFLRFLPDCLNPGGRVAILSFHSGEDRRVKHAFWDGLEAGVYQRIAEGPTRPNAVEVRSNPRAASARLRWAVRASGSVY